MASQQTINFVNCCYEDELKQPPCDDLTIKVDFIIKHRDTLFSRFADQICPCYLPGLTLHFNRAFQDGIPTLERAELIAAMTLYAA